MSSSDGISVRRFAARIGVPEIVLLRWCRAGKIIGARKHPLTKRWWIYPPAKIAVDMLPPQSVRRLRKGGAV